MSSTGTDLLDGEVVALLLALVVFAIGRGGYCADVVIQPSQTYQTIEGWGNGSGTLAEMQFLTTYRLLGPTIADPVNHQLMDYLAGDLGLTGTRIQEMGSRVDGSGNDDGDCDVINWGKFQPMAFDDMRGRYMAYFKNCIVAGGSTSSFYTSTGYANGANSGKPWVGNHPGERAQQIWASALYWKTNFGVNVNYAVIANEPSGTYGTPTILDDDIKALGPRLTALGLPTQIQYAEGVSPQNDWGFITPVLADPDLWPYVGRLSYHNYGAADPYRSYIRDLGNGKNIPRAQTEMDPAGVDNLYDDLTLGGVSYWEESFSSIAGSGYMLAPNAGYTSWTPTSRYFQIRQVTHYVRPGALRIGAVSSDSSLRVLAFSKKGAETVVFWNDTGGPGQTINLSGLAPGTYGLCQSSGTLFQELGIKTVGAAGTLTLTITAGVVATLYPRSTANQPPTIMTWGANPGRVSPPATTAILSVSANDPDLDTLTYNWSVASQPNGASAMFATPANASTAVSNLTVVGVYVFSANVSDGVNIASQQVYLVVGSNQPPLIGVTGFRFGSPYGYEMDIPNPTVHGIVTLPVPSLALSANVTDLENDSMNGLWTVVGSPAGATNLTLGGTTYIYASYRASVSGMTVVGDYTFQIAIGDATHTSTALAVCTVNPANAAPSIVSTLATPATLTLPLSTTQLSGVMNYSGSDVLRNWWAVKAVPAGAKPLFDHQGTTNTAVSNLVIPGSYTFTLRAFDDLHMATKDVTVTVNPAPGAPVITSAGAASVIVGAPVTYTITANNSPTGYNATNLAPGLICNNGVISGTPTAVGTYNIQLSATNASGAGRGNLAMTVQLPLPVITSSANADGLVNTPIAFTITAANVATNFSSANLPAGLALNAISGAITGTPTSAGTYLATICAANSSGTTTGTLSIVIYNGAAPTPAVTSALGATGTVGLSFSYTITATNNPTGFFAIGLPSGLSFDPTQGGIWGRPLVTGVFTVTLRATNRGGTGSATLVLTVISEPRPQFETVAKRNGFDLSFLTLTNWLYGLDYIDNLMTTNWAELTNGVAGDGTMQTVADPATNVPARYYRIKAKAP